MIELDPEKRQRKEFSQHDSVLSIFVSLKISFDD